MRPFFGDKDSIVGQASRSGVATDLMMGENGSAGVGAAQRNTWYCKGGYMVVVAVCDGIAK